MYNRAQYRASLGRNDFEQYKWYTTNRQSASNKHIRQAIEIHNQKTKKNVSQAAEHFASKLKAQRFITYDSAAMSLFLLAWTCTVPFLSFVFLEGSVGLEGFRLVWRGRPWASHGYAFVICIFKGVGWFGGGVGWFGGVVPELIVLLEIIPTQTSSILCSVVHVRKSFVLIQDSLTKKLFWKS